MYFSTGELASHPGLYSNTFYKVVTNPKLESYESFDGKQEDHLPNYLVVNLQTGAIEFAADQLAAVADVADKLQDAWKHRVSPVQSDLRLN